ncbi:MAG: DUF4369 domain-containing protein [Bacteroides sp.]|nr:DUF4369 domain-containing protein [Bacteroides sp.]MCM1413569.1 DUF4369 domain-containing protein [Bacteroides sp.]MCM1471123.1 DUF4369 domain-containing protein [Bacteroides sp.]
MRDLLISILVVLGAMLTACSDADSFVVRGTVKDAGTRSVTLSYYSAGGLKSTTVTMVNGTFSIVGQAESPTLAFLTIAPENLRIATLVVKNGDEITVDADPANPLISKVEGNNESKEIAKWLKDNLAAVSAGRSAEINEAIARYVGENPAKLSSTALMSAYFHHLGFEAKSDSLYSLLDQKVRTPDMTQGFNTVVSGYLAAVKSEPLPLLSLYERRDSIVRINPMRHSATLICFLSEDRRGRDSVVKVIRELTGRFNDDQLMAVEISTAPDSASWRESLGRDTASWAQTWVVGSVASTPVRRLGISRVPFFIVADSAGKQIYRGPSIKAAEKIVETQL